MWLELDVGDEMFWPVLFDVGDGICSFADVGDEICSFADVGDEICSFADVGVGIWWGLSDVGDWFEMFEFESCWLLVEVLCIGDKFGGVSASSMLSSPRSLFELIKYLDFENVNNFKIVNV